LKSEPPPSAIPDHVPSVAAQPSDLAAPPPNPEQLLEPLAAAIGSEMLAQLGPDFKERVMDLVAQRIAATVAEQMLQSFGQTNAPSRRQRVARVALAPDSDVPDAKLPAKRQRKRIAKH
jgi:hypothetical protein